MTKKEIYETIIIGAGIGGVTASIYASRKNMKYKIISKDIGGQLYESGEILNYTGIVETSGVDLVSTLKKQLKFNNVEVCSEEVKSIIRLKNNNLKIETNKNFYETQSVLLALGSKPRKLNVKGEDEFSKKGVTYCAICDGPLFFGKDVAIVGGGNSALEAANFMSSIAKKIYLITENKELRGFDYLINSVKSKKNIEIISNVQVKKIKGDTFVNELQYENKSIKSLNKIKVLGVIVEIGRIQDNSIAKGLVDLDEQGHLKVDRWGRCYNKNKTLDDVFAIGDCTDIGEYQCIISAGMGATALLKAVKGLSKKSSS